MARKEILFIPLVLAVGFIGGYLWLLGKIVTSGMGGGGGGGGGGGKRSHH